MIAAPLVLLAALAGRLAATPSTELQSARDFGCTEWHDCRRLALAAADRGDYEAFHDLAWRAIQTGPPKDPALMFLLARAQALSGRPHDALIMLQRLADMGVASDVAASDEFVRTRQLPGWPEVSASIDRLTHPDSPSPVSSPAVAPRPTATAPSPAPPTVPSSGSPPSRSSSSALGPDSARFSTESFTLGGLAYDAVSRRSCGGLRSRRLSGISRHRGDRD